MSTIVPMPVRVKPPPADTGEIISPGCASFEIATPSNGARTVMSARSVRRWFTRLSDTFDLLLRQRDPRLERLDLRARRVDLGLADDLLLDELLAGGRGSAPLRAAGPRPRRRRAARPRAAPRRPRAPPAPASRPAVASTWPLADRLALLDEHLEDLAGHLRRDRRAAPRRHVAGRVQHGAGRRAAAGLRGHGRDRHRRRLDARRPEPAAGRDGDREQRERDPRTPAAAAAAREVWSMRREARSSLRFATGY